VPLVLNLTDRMLRWYSIPLVLLAWEALSRSGMVHVMLVPSLSVIATELMQGLSRGDLLYHSGITLGRAACGFTMAVVAGVVIGLLMGRSSRFEALVEPLFSFGYPVPKIALYPLFVFIFGLGTLSKIALVFLECLYPVAVNTYFGVKSVERIYVWAARNMGATQRQIFWRVLLPSAAPYIFSSLRIAAHVALITVIILEMIGDSVGLGYYVTFASASFNFARSFAGLAMIVFWGFLIDRTIIWVRNRVIFWEQTLSLA
jgi:NitT/TauT family transport system permease protein